MKTLVVFILTFSSIIGYAQKDNTLYHPDAKKILDKVSAKYNAYKAMQVDVSLNTINKDADINTTTNMNITLSGDKYKITVDKDLIMYCDGESIWNISVTDNEGTQEEYDISQSNEEITPSNIWTIYEKGFQYIINAEMTKGTITSVEIDLAPENKDLDYFKIRMSVNKKTNEIISMRVFAKDGTHYVYKLDNFIANPKVDDNNFKFIQANHPDVEMEDMR